VNTNVLVPVLIDYLKQKTGLSLAEKETLDLAAENGDMVMDLPNRYFEVKRY
jgi:hypothetical protein